MKNLINSYLNVDADKVLVSDHEHSYTQREFTERVYAYAKTLREKWKNLPKRYRGAAIVLERNADYLAAIFACWMADGYYLPLNADTPWNINEKQIQQTNVSILLQRENENEPIQFLTVPLREDGNGLQEEDLDTAYIIFTSGSTGDKKGVAISKSSFSAYCASIADAFENCFLSSSVIINGEMTFDISLADIAFALVFKTEICLTSQSMNLLSLCDLIGRRHVESIYAVPSTWEKILELENVLPGVSFSKVRNIFSGGEQLSASLLQRMRDASPLATIHNMYGPTEFTVNALYYEVNADNSCESSVPLGRPLPNVVTHINTLGRDDRAGELFLSGPQLMTGYVNAQSPVIVLDGHMFYPTGDLVYEDDNGLIHYVGRLRDYEKILGYRINLMSIETMLQQQISSLVKVIVNDSKIYYIIKRNLPETDASIKLKLIDFAEQSLPNYERPFEIIFVDDFPLNSSGKLDVQVALKACN